MVPFGGIDCRDGRRAPDAAVVCLAGLVQVPGRDPGLGQDDPDNRGLPGRDVPAHRRGPDQRPDRQREDRHDLACRADRGAQQRQRSAGSTGPRSALACPPTRSPRAGPSQPSASPSATWSLHEPARGLRCLHRAAGSGLGVLQGRQLPRPPRDPRRSSRDARRGAGPAVSG